MADFADCFVAGNRGWELSAQRINSAQARAAAPASEAASQDGTDAAGVAGEPCSACAVTAQAPQDQRQHGGPAPDQRRHDERRGQNPNLATEAAGHRGAMLDDLHRQHEHRRQQRHPSGQKPARDGGGGATTPQFARSQRPVGLPEAQAQRAPHQGKDGGKSRLARPSGARVVKDPHRDDEVERQRREQAGSKHGAAIIVQRPE